MIKSYEASRSRHFATGSNPTQKPAALSFAATLAKGSGYSIALVQSGNLRETSKYWRWVKTEKVKTPKPTWFSL